MDEYHDLLNKYGFPEDSKYFRCETPEQLLISLEELNTLYDIHSKNHYNNRFGGVISEVKMLNRSKLIDKVLNNG